MRNAIMKAAMLAALLPCSGAWAGTGAHTHGDAPTDEAVRARLVRYHATFDGARIVDLRPTGDCEGEVETTAGSVHMRWRDIGPLAPRTDGGRRVYRIRDRGRIHILSAPVGREADEMARGFEILRQLCGKGMR